MRWLLALLVCLALSAPAQLSAGEIVGGLSQNRVSLTANYSGSEILIFGAIRHDATRFDQDAPFDVIIVVEGPRQPVAIRRKARRFGIWMNVDVAYMASVPSFYAVATTAPLTQILSPDEDARLRISAAQAIRPEQVTGVDDERAAFSDSLLRLRQRSQAYQSLTRWVTLDRDILFRANVRLPANLTEGAYTTRMYLVREGVVVHQFRTAIFVRKEGIERWLSQMAYDQPLIYGLMALALALIAGWGASEASRFFRR
jgi:uncharacterized protein (TIGR02186 family)